MTTIAIVPDNTESPPTRYRAVAGALQAVGKTAGEALDALTDQLSTADTGTLLVVQHRRPDQFFAAVEQQRLEYLMNRWRAARDAGAAFSAEERAELEKLVEAELRAATGRAEGCFTPSQRT